MNSITKLLFFSLIFFTQISVAQKASTPPKSSKPQTQTATAPKPPTHQDIFNTKMHLPKPLSMAQGVVAMGTTFLGNPYPKSNVDTSHKTGPTKVVLQKIEREVLVVNLKKFDCVTFVESMIALIQTQRNPSPTFDLFKKKLTHVRYRNDYVNYATRLHYFSDWIYENEKNGILTNITKEIGGEIYKKDVFFMSLKRDTLYGNMADPTTFYNVKMVEDAITKREKWYIPKEKVGAMEFKLKEGDIIGITNVLAGMDMAHAGIVTWRNGRAYMLHASSQFGQVIVTDVPLVDYLLRNKGQSGIMVGRLKD
jgi:Protein of unknown function (DUF1460)